MNVRKFLSKSQGFSLMEMTITLGLLGISALTFMNLSENVNTSTKRAESMMTKTQFTSALGTYFYSTLSCTDFQALTFRPTPPNTVQLTDLNTTPITLNNWRISELASVQSGSEFKDFTLTKLRGTVKLSPSLPTVVIAGETLQKTSLYIQAIVLVPKPINREFAYYFNVPVLANNAGQVRACGEEKTITENCTSLGGVLNPVTLKCDLDKTCLVKGTFQRLTCSPSNYGCSQDEGPARVNVQTGAMTCPAGAVENETGEKVWNHSVSCGKKCDVTITNTMKWVTCLKCP